jgi:hypothetical protein
MNSLHDWPNGRSGQPYIVLQNVYKTVFQTGFLGNVCLFLRCTLHSWSRPCNELHERLRMRQLLRLTCKAYSSTNVLQVSLILRDPVVFYVSLNSRLNSVMALLTSQQLMRSRMHVIMIVLGSYDCLCGLVVSVEDYKHRGPGFDSRGLLRIFLRELGLERGPLSLVIG